MYKQLISFLVVIFIALSFTSCVSSKKVIYLNNLQDTTSAGELSAAQSMFMNKIQKNDQLWITFGSSNPSDLGPFSSAGGGGGAAAMAAQPGGNPITGYLVESDGTIQLPYLGKVKAEGLTRLELQADLAEKIKDYTKNPIVNIRFLNYTFSVLGEVGRPGRFPMSSERTTVLDAIGLAGDLTTLGRRDNILVVREEDGQRKFGRINLLSKDIFNSPYFYLKTNDVLYVEPVATKFVARTGVPQYLSVIAVGLSLIITLINVTR